MFENEQHAAAAFMHGDPARRAMRRSAGSTAAATRILAMGVCLMLAAAGPFAGAGSQQSAATTSTPPPAATSAPPTPAPAAASAALPAFSAADQLRMARSLCGAARRGTAMDDITTPAAPVSGFLSRDGATLHVELLSTSFVEQRQPRHLIVFAGHRVENGTIDSGEAARSDICAGLLAFRKGRWEAIAQAASLAQTGFNGRNPDVALEAIGPDRQALRITEGQWSAGSSMTRVALYEQSGVTFRELLSVAVAADDCGAEPPCFRFEGTLTPVVPAASAAAAQPASASSDVQTASSESGAAASAAASTNATAAATVAAADAGASAGADAAYDLQLRLTGTYRSESGRIMKMPTAPLMLRLRDGLYAPVRGTGPALALWEAVQSPWR